MNDSSKLAYAIRKTLTFQTNNFYLSVYTGDSYLNILNKFYENERLFYDNDFIPVFKSDNTIDLIRNELYQNNYNPVFRLIDPSYELGVEFCSNVINYLTTNELYMEQYNKLKPKLTELFNKQSINDSESFELELKNYIPYIKEFIVHVLNISLNKIDNVSKNNFRYLYDFYNTNLDNIISYFSYINLVDSFESTKEYNNNNNNNLLIYPDQL
jgi:hypothetical protein